MCKRLYRVLIRTFRTSASVLLMAAMIPGYICLAGGTGRGIPAAAQMEKAVIGNNDVKIRYTGGNIDTISSTSLQSRTEDTDTSVSLIGGVQEFDSGAYFDKEMEDISHSFAFSKKDLGEIEANGIKYDVLAVDMVFRTGAVNDDASGENHADASRSGMLAVSHTKGTVINMTQYKYGEVRTYTKEEAGKVLSGITPEDSGPLTVYDTAEKGFFIGEDGCNVFIKGGIPEGCTDISIDMQSVHFGRGTGNGGAEDISFKVNTGSLEEALAYEPGCTETVISEQETEHMGRKVRVIYSKDIQKGESFYSVAVYAVLDGNHFLEIKKTRSGSEGTDELKKEDADRLLAKTEF